MMKKRQRHPLRKTTYATFAGAAVLSLTFLPIADQQAFADDDWWDNTPYYEEDGWFDVTEWFDGNDYNPTDESILRIDDETYDASEDVASDADSDWDYGYDNDPYNDSDTRSYTGSDEGSASSSQYGYDDRTSVDNWFYDYWDGGYFSYVDVEGDGKYESYTAWYDYDRDGFYDAYYAYADSDGDGTFDRSDYTRFRQISDSERKQSDSQKPGSSKSRNVSGKVVNTKKVSVRDTKHLVAEIQNDRNDRSDRNDRNDSEEGRTTRYLVDLGPATSLRDKEIAEGQRLQASGPEVKVGDKRVIVAQELTMDGNTVAIDRQSESLSGEVADTKRMSVRGKEHLIAILATGEDKKMLVDLGLAENLKVDPSQGDRIRVTGVPVKAGGRPMLMADEGALSGQEFTVNRHQRQASADRDDVASSSSGANDRDGSQVRGEVTSTDTVTVRGDRRRTITVAAESGKKILVDLGSEKDQPKQAIARGDHIEARGTLVKAKNGRPVLLARSCKVGDGENKETVQPTTPSRRPSGRKITGEIVESSQVTVRDQSRQLVKIESDDGGTYVVDLGSPKRLDQSLEKGDTISVRGPVMKSGGQAIVVARELDHNGNGTTSIQRMSR